MIVHINHISQSKKPKGNQRSPQSELASLVTGSLMSLVEEGVLDARLAPSLRIHLDWIQYKTNFRDPVIVRRTTNPQGQTLPLAEIAIDLRQADAARLPDELARAVKNIGAGPEANGDNHVYLDEFKPYRDCLMWSFNRLFWRHLGDWEALSGKGFEAALPGGSSDANHPQAVSDAVADFWTLLRDLENRNQLPADIVGLEIGVGSGARAAAWLDRFKALDAQCGTNFYSRLHFILGDYSPTSLERALQAVAHHGEHASGIPLDALNPEKSLTKYRFKLMYVHLTNVYDNLPFDDLVRRDGKLYLVEVRAYLNGPAVDRLTADFGLTRQELPDLVKTLLDGGPFAVFPGEKGVEFWRRLWDTFKLEERLRVLDDREEDHVPPGPQPHAPRGPARRSARRCAVSHFAGGGGELRQHAAAAAPARVSAGAGHLRQRHGRLPQGIPRTREAGRLAGDLGQRRAAPRRRRAGPGTTCTSRRSRTGRARRPAFCIRRNEITEVGGSASQDPP